MSNVMAFLRKQYLLKVIPYLDDILIIEPSLQNALTSTRICINQMQQLGWLINFSKSSMVPSQDLIFLGIRFNTQRGLAFLSSDRQLRILNHVRKFLQMRQRSAKAFSRLLGHLASTNQVIPWARTHARMTQMHYLTYFKRQPNNFHQLIPVSKQIRLELEWWTHPTNLAKGRALTDPEWQILHTDASKLGWGGIWNNKTIQGIWTAREKTMHINVLELKAVWNTLRHFRQHLHQQSVLIRSDNFTAVQYILNQGGTRSYQLNCLAIKILLWAEHNLHALTASFLSGHLNTQADYLSRHQLDPGEWELNPKISQLVVANLGFPEVDLMAKNQNKKCDQYLSRWLGDTRKKALQVYLDRVLKIIEFNVTAEEEFIQVAQSLEASRKKWQQVEKDLREKQESLLKCEIDRSALQVKLKHARNQVDVEMKKRQRAETELEKAERQMQLIAELLKSDGQAAVPLSDSVLAFFGGGRVNAAAQGSGNSRLSMVDESCTSFLSHSDISYDQTEDDLDLEGFAGKPVKLKTRERRRSSLAPLIAPLLKRPRPSAAAAIVAENIKEAIISKTTMLVTDSGPMAISTMEAVPRRRSRRSRAISSLQDQALGLPQINEAEHELEPEYVPAPPSNPARTHSFLSKTMIRAELCSVCGQKTSFGKMSLKCRDCRILIHPECRDLCPKVCSSSSLPSSGIYPKNGQGILADFAPVESPRIPGIVIQCVNEIERQGLKESSEVMIIELVPGCDRVVKEMKQRLVQGKVKSQQLAKEDIHAVCGALK
ncbi:uncharacterized protein WCC33_013536 [Rhinophrynus dorsalis]